MASMHLEQRLEGSAVQLNASFLSDRLSDMVSWHDTHKHTQVRQAGTQDTIFLIHSAFSILYIYIVIIKMTNTFIAASQLESRSVIRTLLAVVVTAAAAAAVANLCARINVLIAALAGIRCRRSE